MATEVTVALIMGALALLGTLVTFLSSARKNELELLRGVIAELRKRIEELEDTNEDLENWAERLVCQVKEAGLIPAKFIRHRKVKEIEG